MNGISRIVLLNRSPLIGDSGIQAPLSCDAAILNTWPLKSPWKGKIERMITPGVLWPGLEVMYILVTSSHGSEPNHMGPTRLQEPLEYVVVLCAQEEEMRS